MRRRGGDAGSEMGMKVRGTSGSLLYEVWEKKSRSIHSMPHVAAGGR